MAAFSLTAAQYAVLSELSVNICAAWFAAAFIGPNFGLTIAPGTVLILLVDIGFGTLFLVLAMKLRALSDITAL